MKVQNPDSKNLSEPAFDACEAKFVNGVLDAVARMVR
jgi:transcription termination factor NusB